MTAPARAAAGASCEWRWPGHDPFLGDVPGAVDDYRDIPAPTRERLKARMRRFAYDDIVAIRRDAIEGEARYEPALLDMHFGNRRLCRQVTRKTWPANHEERGLAYCEDGHCIVVPLVCRNVSRIVRKPVVTTMGGPSGSGEPLVFEPPSAGLPVGPATPATEEPPTRTPLALPPPASRLPPASERPPGPVALPPMASLPPVVDAPPPPEAPGPPAAPPVVVPPPETPPLPPQPGPVPVPVLPPTGVPPLPPAPAVPEPATALLWAAGLAAGVAWARRRRCTAVVSGPSTKT